MHKRLLCGLFHNTIISSDWVIAKKQNKKKAYRWGHRSTTWIKSYSTEDKWCIMESPSSDGPKQLPPSTEQIQNDMGSFNRRLGRAPVHSETWLILPTWKMLSLPDGISKHVADLIFFYSDQHRHVGMAGEKIYMEDMLS